MDIRRHITGTFGTNILLLALGIGTSIFSSRLLGPTGKGEYAIFLAAINLAVLVLGFGTESAVAYFVAKDKLSFQVLLNTIFAFLIGVIILFAGIVLFNQAFSDNEFLLPKDKGDLYYQFVLLGCFITTLLINFLLAVLSGKRMFGSVNLYKIIRGVLNVSIFAVLFFVYHEDQFIDSGIVFSIYFTISFIGLVILLFFFQRQIKLVRSWAFLSRKQLWEVFRWGTISYVAVLAQFLNYRVDFWFVDYYAGKTALGYYSLSTNLAQMFWLLPVAVATVIAPYTAAGKKGAMLEKTLMISRWVFAISVVLALATTSVSAFGISLLYSDVFLPAAKVLNILLIGVIPFCLTKVYAGFISGEGIHHQNMIASIAGLIATVILDFILIPKYGIEGAAWATSISFMITTAYVIYTIQSKYKVSIRNIIFLNQEDLMIAKKYLKNLRPQSR